MFLFGEGGNIVVNIMSFTKRVTIVLILKTGKKVGCLVVS